MGGGLESRCVGRVCGADGAARHHPHRTHNRNIIETTKIKTNEINRIIFKSPNI